MMPPEKADQRVVVFGASGGIGDALARQLQAAGSCETIYTGARNLPFGGGGCRINFAFDLTDEASIVQAADMIGGSGPLDLAIVATGMLTGPDQPMPERGWREITAPSMARMFAINTIGPALLAKHFLPLMRRDRRSIFAVLSARVGSIADNRLGGWHSYRSSKAALNMLVRNFAIEFAARNPLGIVVAIHPGTVDTSLSKPFQRNVAAASLLQPDHSAAHIRATIDRLTPADSGGLFAWNSERIPY